MAVGDAAATGAGGRTAAGRVAEDSGASGSRAREAFIRSIDHRVNSFTQEEWCRESCQWKDRHPQEAAELRSHGSRSSSRRIPAILGQRGTTVLRADIRAA